MSSSGSAGLDVRARGLDGASVAAGALSGAFVVAGGLVAAVNSAAPFDRGSWLAAYLVLVGGVSQALLALGPLALPTAEPAGALRRWQLGLWNAGTLLVPAGVLSDASAPVVLGSVLVLAALACFAAGARPLPHAARGPVLAYQALVVALAASVVVGMALAGATPGTWA